MSIPLKMHENKLTFLYARCKITFKHETRGYEELNDVKENMINKIDPIEDKAAHNVRELR